MSSTGQIVGGIVGAAVGFFAGGNVVVGAQIGMMIGGAIDPPDGPVINGPRLDDLSVQTATYGAFIPRNYGTIAQTGNIFWLQGDALTETPRAEESGGKGGPTSTTNLWDYSATFALGLCEGPIDGVCRIWINGQLFYDVNSDDITTIIVSNQSSDFFTLYTGTDTQLADPLIQADKGIANVPAYRGLAYIVFENLPLAKYNNSLAGAQIKVEIVKDGTSAYTSTTRVINNAVFPLNQWYAAARNDETMVAVAVSSDLAAYTKDGNTWSTGTLPSNGDWRCVAFGFGKFLAVQANTGNTAYSYDGITWVASTTLPGLDYRKLVWTGDFFCLIAFGSSRTFSSLDGIVWVESALPSTVGHKWADLAWNGTTLCAIYKYTGTNIAAVSTRGFTWTLVTLPALKYWNSIESDGTNFLLVSSDRHVAYSTDGITWTDAALSYTGVMGTVGFEWKLAWNGGAWIIGLGNSAKYLISEDGGLTWVIFTGTETQSNTVMVVSSYDHVFIGIPVNQDAEFIYKKLTISSTTLSAIVESECLESNLLTAGDLDATELTDSVRGYRIASLGALRGGIDPLRAAFPFDVVQHGYQIKFKRRGSASVATITADELDARAAGEAPGIQITNSREMDTLLPSKLLLKYLDVTREYDTNEQPSDRGL